jgi:branched-chain amino acid transport system substrate-binding protein
MARTRVAQSELTRRPTRHVKVTAIGAGMLAAALLVSACSSSADAGGDGKSAVVNSKLTGAPIVVGNIGTYSGPTASSQAQTKDLMVAWQNWMNAHDGINGHPVKVIIKDDGGNATKALSEVKELVQQDKVVAIIGDHSNSDVTWASYIKTTDVPVIGGESLDLPFVTNPSFFPVGPSIVAGLYGVVSLAKTVGPKMGLLYCAEAPQCAGAVPLYQALGKAVGVEVPYSAKVAASSPDYTAQCQGLKNAGVQSVSVLAPSDTVVRVHKACASQGVNVPEIAQDGTVTTSWLKEPSLDKMLAVAYVHPWFDTSLPAIQDFQAAVKQYAPSIVSELNEESSDSWAGGMLFAAAAKLAPGATITAASIKAGLYKLKNETVGGLTSPLNFTPGKATSIKCYFAIGISDGKFTVPDTQKTACAPAAVVDPIVASFPK